MWIKGKLEKPSTHEWEYSIQRSAWKCSRWRKEIQNATGLVVFKMLEGEGGHFLAPNIQYP
jgi:hypothetical protein